VIRVDEDAGSLEEFALYLGIDPVKEPSLMWIAEHCRVAPLPCGWQEFFTSDGDSYFHHAKQGITVWHHPLDLYFKTLVAVRRANGQDYRPGGHSPTRTHA
jgi:centrosomal protein CEP164